MNNGFWIVDYYKNGQIQMEGFSTVNIPNEEIFDGLVLYYHANGKPFHRANYKKENFTEFEKYIMNLVS